MKQELKEFLEKGKDWEKMETDNPSVNVVRSPPTKTKEARIFIEINPKNENGVARKRRGLFITDVSMLNQFAETLVDESVLKLAEAIEEINPKEDKKIRKIKIKK